MKLRPLESSFHIGPISLDSILFSTLFMNALATCLVMSILWIRSFSEKGPGRATFVGR